MYIYMHTFTYYRRRVSNVMVQGGTVTQTMSA